MTQDKIEEIIKENCDWGVNLNQHISAKEIYKLHLEAQLELLDSVLFHPNKPGYRRGDVYDKIKELETKLKELG